MRCWTKFAPHRVTGGVRLIGGLRRCYESDLFPPCRRYPTGRVMEVRDFTRSAHSSRASTADTHGLPGSGSRRDTPTGTQRGRGTNRAWVERSLLCASAGGTIWATTAAATTFLTTSTTSSRRGKPESSRTTLRWMVPARRRLQHPRLSRPQRPHLRLRLRLSRLLRLLPFRPQRHRCLCRHLRQRRRFPHRCRCRPRRCRPRRRPSHPSWPRRRARPL